MATNFRFKGDVIQGTNGSGSAIVSGQPILLGDQGLAGFCLEDIANGASGSVALGGVWEYPVKGENATGNAAIAIYDKLYYTAGAANMDVVATGTVVGIALAAVSSGSTTTIDVLMIPATA